LVASVAIASAVAAGLASERTAAADGLSGKWKQGPLREEYTVQQWLPGCGPAPVNGATGGGEIVDVNVEGDDLSFIGGGRVFRTNQCYDQLPTLVRDAHSRDASGRAWRTRCTTPPSDPRRASMNTLVTATSDTHIDLAETGRYEITLKEGRCTADVKRARSFDLVTQAPAAPVASAPAPKPEATQPAQPVPGACAHPGEAARLEVRPSRKLLKTGESFTFQSVVRDAKGCATGTSTEWRVGDGVTSITIDPSGKVTVAPGASEGPVEVIATAAGKSARVTVDVSSPAHYDALLAQSGLNASGENEEAAVAVIATGTLGGAGATAEDTARHRRNVFVVVVGALVAVLGIVALVGWRRSRRAAAIERDAEERHAARVREAEERRRERVAQHAAQLQAHKESVERAEVAAKEARDAELEDARATVCPACHTEYPARSTFCPRDGNRLVPVTGVETNPPAAAAICPTCKRGFDAATLQGSKVCPHDGDELVPFPIRGATPSGEGAHRSKGKICPTCGGRFDGSAAFCGKDGTALLLLN